MPDRSQLHVDQPLTNLAIAYSPKEFTMIADKVVPIIPVPKKSDLYYVYQQKDRFTLPETIRGPKGEANEVDWNTSTEEYTCISHALKDLITDEDMDEADQPLNLYNDTTEFLTDLLLLKREQEIASTLTTAGNYGASYRTTLTGTDQWSDASSDPIAAIDDAKNALFYPANTLILGKEVYDKLRRHPQLLDHVKGGATSRDAAQIGLEQMKAIFEVENVLVGNAKYNTANMAKTASYSYVWGKYAILAYVNPAPKAKTVTWRKMLSLNSKGSVQGYKVRRYREDKKGGGGTWIEVEMCYVNKEVCADLGYLISDAIA
ncbi:MAG: hypothetical protein WC322_02285 [Candidatus Paceibacterota bacterium]|jgi:hypothetical protein